jgi:hypothetical protein
MKLMKRPWILILLLASQSPARVHATETLSTSVNLAFPSVQEGGGARAIALGSTYVGIAEGSTALLWNPAGLAHLGTPELALHHQSALLGAFQEIAVLALPLGKRNGLAFSGTYADQGAFEGRDALGAETAAYSNRAMGAALGWGFAVGEDLALGLGAKWNQQDLAGSALSAIAGDLGLLWSPSRTFSVGAAYSNFGPDVAGWPLAQGLRLGCSNYWNKGGPYQWMLGLSGEALSHSDNSVHLGLEGTLHQALALRAGYSFNSPNPEQPGGLRGWTAGAGVVLRDLSLDYAWVPLADLGSTQRVSLSYAFADHSKPDCLKSTQGPNETVLLFSDQDFAYTGAEESEVLSEVSQARLEQALRHISDVCGGSLRISGTTTLQGDSASKRAEGSRAANADQLRVTGERRVTLVRAYVHKHMSAARVSSLVSPYSQSNAKDAPTAIFQFIVY